MVAEACQLVALHLVESTAAVAEVVDSVDIVGMAAAAAAVGVYSNQSVAVVDLSKADIV